MNKPMDEFFELLEDHVDACAGHRALVALIQPLQRFNFTESQLSRELDERYQRTEDTREALMEFVRPFIEKVPR